MIFSRIVAALVALTVTAGIASAEVSNTWRLAQQAKPNGQSAPQPAQEAAPVPHRTVIVHFDNWTVTCQEFTQGARKRVCSATLQVRRKENNQVVLQWTFTLNDRNEPITLLQTPTGIQIEQGVAVKLGKTQARKIPYTQCFPNHCTAATTIDGRFVRDVGSSDTAEIVIRAASGPGLKFNISLKGFTKAYATLRQ